MAAKTKAVLKEQANTDNKKRTGARENVAEAENKKQEKAYIKKQTIKFMKSLGTYKAEFMPLIELYAELREEYEILHTEYVAGGYSCVEYSAADTGKKSPVVAVLETLRKDICNLSDRLMLNPKALNDGKKSPPTKNSSKLAVALNEMKELLS